MAVPFHFQITPITFVAYQRLVTLMQLFLERCHDLLTLLTIMFALLRIEANHIASILHPDLFDFQRRRIGGLFPWTVDHLITALVVEDVMADFVLFTHTRAQDI